MTSGVGIAVVTYRKELRHSLEVSCVCQDTTEAQNL